MQSFGVDEVFQILKKLLIRKSKKTEYDGDLGYLKQFTLSKDIYQNLGQLKEIMNNSLDIKTRDFKIAGAGPRAAIIYISTLVNEDLILEHIVKPLMIESHFIADDMGMKIDFQRIKDSMFTGSEVQEVKSFDEIVLSVMSGDTFLCIQGYDKGFTIATRGYVGRNIGEPAIEPSVKGPQEAFVETIKNNIALIRRRIRDPNLTFQAHTVGRRGKLEVVVVYIKGIVDQDIVDEVNRRITALDIDGSVSNSQLGSYLTDNPNSIFPLYQLTERPDKVVSSMVEGRVAILLEGSPGALLVPCTLLMCLQAVDDYYENWLVGSIIRISRYVAFFISGLLPALYVSVISFHPGMLPTTLALSITETRSGVPFPAIVEALIMELTLELLQEASVRLPRAVGQTVSIVGGLVIGQAAVQAGLVSPIMVIVIAMAAISSFAIPNFSLNLASRVIRVPLMLLATSFGAFGISMGVLFLLSYLASLKSFGVRYLNSLSPYRIRDWKDTVIVAPQWVMGKRPEFLSPEDTQRQKVRKARKKNES